MNNKLRALLLFGAILFAAGTVSAAACEEIAPNPEEIGAITFNDTTYSKACYKFSWNHLQTVDDFNNYIIHTTGDVTTGDFNFRGTAWSVCTVEPGDSVQIYVRAYDGNAEGIYCGMDYNAGFGSGTVTQGAMYFVYMLFAAFAGVIGLLIILFVGLYVIKKFGIKIH